MADPSGSGRLQNTELIIPICIGTVSFHLGKKATEFHSHRWVVYVRGPNNEDVSHIIQKVTFNLHSSFPNPDRTVAAPPYELVESGWGEFEIGITLTFQPDAGEGDLQLFHRLRLYADDDPMGAHAARGRPVATEQYEELVFVDPRAGFYQRVRATQPRPAPPLSIAQHIPPFREAQELATIMEVRRKVAQVLAGLRAADSAEAAADGGGASAGGALPMPMATLSGM